MHAHIHVGVRTCMHACLHARTDLCVCAQACMHACTCPYTPTHSCMHVRTHACTHAWCMHAHMQAHAHAHTHTRSLVHLLTYSMCACSCWVSFKLWYRYAYSLPREHGKFASLGQFSFGPMFEVLNVTDGEVQYWQRLVNAAIDTCGGHEWNTSLV